MKKFLNGLLFSAVVWCSIVNADVFIPDCFHVIEANVALQDVQECADAFFAASDKVCLTHQDDLVKKSIEMAMVGVLSSDQEVRLVSLSLMASIVSSGFGLDNAASFLEETTCEQIRSLSKKELDLLLKIKDLLVRQHIKYLKTDLLFLKNLILAGLPELEKYSADWLESFEKDKTLAKKMVQETSKELCAVSWDFLLKIKDVLLKQNIKHSVKTNVVLSKNIILAGLAEVEKCFVYWFESFAKDKSEAAQKLQEISQELSSASEEVGSAVSGLVSRLSHRCEQLFNT